MDIEESTTRYPLVFQLDFEDFDLEQSHTCSYDSLTVLGDVEGAQEIGKKHPIAPPHTHTSPPRPAVADWRDGDLVSMCVCSGAVRGRPPSPRPVLPQRDGAAVLLGRHRRSQRLQGVADLHQPQR